MSECFAMVRGSALRVTGLTDRGSTFDPIRSAVSKSVISVTVDEVLDDAPSARYFDESGKHLRVNADKPTDVIGYMVSASFLRVDPGLLHLLTGVPLVPDASGTVAGFESQTRLPAVPFALEVWSKLTGTSEHGWTLFPFLKGGYLSGFVFENALVSFRLTDARVQRDPRWSVGPHDVYGPWQRLVEPIGRDDAWRTMVTPLAPPAQTEGIIESSDVLDGGSVTTSSDVVDGEFSQTSQWIVDGGGAA